MILPLEEVSPAAWAIGFATGVEPMRRLRTGIFSVAIIASSATAGAADAAAFINGSFEQPGGGPIRRGLANGDTFVTGWVNNGGYQIYESAGQDGIPAGDGTYYVSFGHNAQNGGTLSQTFDTVIGATYTVNYLLRQQQGDDPQQTLIAEILGGPSVSNSGLSTTAWEEGATLSFLASSASTTLRFRDATAISGGLSANYGLDAVRLVTSTSTPGAVPEPSSWAMMIGGFGLVGGAMRRRRHGLHASA